jgi:tetratricopeptide (TPR) repeat protein
LQLAPGQFRWVYYEAYLAIEAGEMKSAVERLEAARKLRPDYLAITLRLADAWLDLNELEKAKTTYKQVVEADGLQAASLYGLGQIALLQRDHAAAIDYFQRALAIQPEANRIHYSMSQALRAAGQSDSAREHLALRGDQQPSIKDPQVESLEALKKGSRMHFIRGMKATRKHDYPAALDAFARGLEREPENMNARISYARTLYLLDNRKQAKLELESVVSKEPSSVMAWFLLGVLEEEASATDTAIRHYREALRQDPDHAGARFFLANSYYRQGHYDRAMEEFATSIRTDPEHMAVYLLYAGALLQAGRGNEEILAVIETAIQHFPEQPLPGYLHIQLLACTDGKAGCNAAQALASARQIHKQQPIPPHRELLALALAAAGQFDEAIAVQEALVTEAIKMAPDEAERLKGNLSGYQSGQLPKAEQLFTWHLVQAPPVFGIGAFRDYPTSRPY